MAKEPWVSVERRGHDITVKGGEVTAKVTHWLDRFYCHIEFELEECDVDAFNLRFEDSASAQDVAAIFTGLKCELTRLGYAVGPFTVRIEEACSTSAIEAAA